MIAVLVVFAVVRGYRRSRPPDRQLSQEERERLAALLKPETAPGDERP